MQAYTDIIAPTILGRKLRQSRDKEMNVSTKQSKKTQLYWIYFYHANLQGQGSFNVLYDNGIEITKYL
jgi:hypothetical protein